MCCAVVVVTVFVVFFASLIIFIFGNMSKGDARATKAAVEMVLLAVARMGCT